MLPLFPCQGDTDNDDGDNDNDDGDNDHDDDNMMVAIPEAGSFLFFAFLVFVLLVNFCFSETWNKKLHRLRRCREVSRAGSVGSCGGPQYSRFC